MLDLKLDKTEFTKLEADFKKNFIEPLEKFKKFVDSKADLEWVKKMLSKINNLIKGLNKPEIKSPEPKTDGAYLTKVPIGYKCASCDKLLPPSLFNERASDYKK